MSARACGVSRQIVAPSRERGSKHRPRDEGLQHSASLPHGSVDRNKIVIVDRRPLNRRSLTGARIETRRQRQRRDGMGCRSLTGARMETVLGVAARSQPRVAPSRERGSKLRLGHHGRRHGQSLPHGSADRNNARAILAKESARSLPHGSADRNQNGNAHVWFKRESLPHGSADRNHEVPAKMIEAKCRSLTGARIETPPSCSVWSGTNVAPSRERGSKHHSRRRRPRGHRVAPSRERGSKHCGHGSCSYSCRRSLTGARIETCRPALASTCRPSLPHGSADRNRASTRWT